MSSQNFFKNKNVKKTGDSFFVQNERGSLNSKSKETVKGKSLVKKFNRLKNNGRKSSQEKGNSNKTTKEETEIDVKKKPFDKKRWRFEKYSNKFKIEQWEERRKKAILWEYRKNTSNATSKFDVQKIYEECTSDEETADNSAIVNDDEKKIPAKTKQESSKDVNNPRGSCFKRAHSEFLRMKEEKNNKKLAREARKEEREKAIKEYKKKKAERYKKLNKKTKKGQPVMKHRLEMLLEEIQNSM